MKRLICLILAVGIICSLTVCREKETLPRPDYPLSEEALTAALEETGLSWSIRQVLENTDGTDRAITYALHWSEERTGVDIVSINSYETEKYGRRLQIIFHEPQNRLWFQQEQKEASWEDWREVLELIARLYGGFEDAEEIYRACSAVKLPKDGGLLWEGTLTGGYFLMRTGQPMKPERFSKGNSVYFDVYESEALYESIQQDRLKPRKWGGRKPLKMENPSEFLQTNGA